MSEPGRELHDEASLEPAPQAEPTTGLPAPAPRRSRTWTHSRKEIARALRRERESGVVDEELGQIIQEIESIRPRSRADCLNGPRPCMFISCKHHLYLDINPSTGSIKMNFPEREVWEMTESCALDIADRGGITLEEVGEVMNLTRERIRQLETRGLKKLGDMHDLGRR